ncbi:MAG: type II toxin-antitoxin system HicB family antitoxin [Tannerellaceae bacterium]|jgi:predicted RNase H-like HicB family nuclease|nr:type II toxin-antitoxin system HicB family antitoxin [Tannerellaceae bacterium]
MKVVHAILEAGKDGFGVIFRELPQVFSFGLTLTDAKRQAAEAIEGWKEALAMDGDEIPEIIRGDFRIDFEFDLPALRKYGSLHDLSEPQPSSTPRQSPAFKHKPELLPV